MKVKDTEMKKKYVAPVSETVVVISGKVLSDEVISVPVKSSQDEEPGGFEAKERIWGDVDWGENLWE